MPEVDYRGGYMGPADATPAAPIRTNISVMEAQIDGLRTEFHTELARLRAPLNRIAGDLKVLQEYFGDRPTYSDGEIRDIAQRLANLEATKTNSRLKEIDGFCLGERVSDIETILLKIKETIEEGINDYGDGDGEPTV